jgi:hypothetical protein
MVKFCLNLPFLGWDKEIAAGQLNDACVFGKMKRTVP